MSVSEISPILHYDDAIIDNDEVNFEQSDFRSLIEDFIAVDISVPRENARETEVELETSEYLEERDDAIEEVQMGLPLSIPQAYVQHKDPEPSKQIDTDLVNNPGDIKQVNCNEKLVNTHAKVIVEIGFETTTPAASKTLHPEISMPNKVDAQQPLKSIDLSSSPNKISDITRVQEDDVQENDSDDELHQYSRVDNNRTWDIERQHRSADIVNESKHENHTAPNKHSEMHEGAKYPNTENLKLEFLCGSTVIIDNAAVYLELTGDLRKKHEDHKRILSYRLEAIGFQLRDDISPKSGKGLVL